MSELINKLKDKKYVRAFGLMAPEEQECYRKVGPENCLYYSSDGSWGETMGFCGGQTFAIKPDYQPEPEYVDKEIGEYNDMLACYINDSWLLLYEVMFLPGFAGFYLKEDVEVRPEWVARYFPNVIAKFRREVK